MRATRMFRSTKDLQKASNSSGKAKSEYILIIQQNPAESKQLRRYLENLGYTVKEYANCSEALEFIKKSSPILIISDITVQGMKGYELCHILKSAPETSSLPFMFVSSSDSTPDKILGFQQGGDDYITKPFEPGEIKVRVESLLRRFKGKKAAPTLDSVPPVKPPVDTAVQLQALKVLEEQKERFKVDSEQINAEDDSEQAEPVQSPVEELSASEDETQKPTLSEESADAFDSAEPDLDDFLDSVMTADKTPVPDKAKTPEPPRAPSDVSAASSESPIGPPEEAAAGSESPPEPKVEAPKPPKSPESAPPEKTTMSAATLHFDKSIRPESGVTLSASKPEAAPEKEKSKPAAPKAVYPSMATEKIIKAQASAKLDMPTRKQIMNAAPAEVYGFALEIYRQLIAAKGEFGAAEFHTIISLCEKMTELSIANNEMLKLALKRTEGTVLEVHNINACIVAMVTGKNLGLPAGELVLLSMAALLFDLGMVRVNPKIFAKKGDLSSKDRSSIQHHVEHGVEIIEKAIRDEFPQECEYITTAIMQHHERENGQGYPNKLRGDQIAQSAKIVGLADTYEAMCHVRFYRDRQTTYRALQEVVAMKKTFFDPAILRAMVNELTFFPPGCYVRLNTDEIGVVIDTSPQHSMRPKVKILVDAEGSPLPTPKTVDLVDSPFIYIAKAIDDEDLVNIP